MRTVAALVAATALVLLGGCSRDPASPEPSPAVTTPATVAPSPSTATSPPLVSESPRITSPTPVDSDPSLIPGADCLNGTWRLVRFVGLGEQATYGTGQGGDVTVAFASGRYTMTGRGAKPITVNLAGSAAELTVDGTVAGTYRAEGPSMVFAVGETSGQGTLKAGAQSQTLPMAQVAQVIAPSGKATMACPKGVLLVALPTVRLEFER